MSEELKPCPFCGGEAEIISGSEFRDFVSEPIDELFFVKCSKCYVPTALFPSPQEARKAWNRRVDAGNTKGGEVV